MKRGWPIWAWMWMTAIMVFGGCGPILSISGVGDAERTIEQARIKNAEQLAPHEYFSAVLYLKKAKEEQGYSEYEASVGYAQKATLFAKRAQKRVQDGESSEGKVGESEPSVTAGESEPEPEPKSGYNDEPSNPPEPKQP